MSSRISNQKQGHPPIPSRPFMLGIEYQICTYCRLPLPGGNDDLFTRQRLDHGQMVRQAFFGETLVHHGFAIEKNDLAYGSYVIIISAFEPPDIMAIFARPEGVPLSQGSSSGNPGNQADVLPTRPPDVIIKIHLELSFLYTGPGLGRKSLPAHATARMGQS